MYRSSRSRSWRRILGLAAAGGLLAALLVLLAQRVSARTYLITDGSRILTYTTFATDPAQVLGQAGLALGEMDTYTTEEVAGKAAITVRRTQKISVTCHGQTTLATSTGETVGELLSRLGLAPAGEDVVSHGMDTYTYDGMAIRIDRKVTREETYIKTLPHEISYCSDPSLPEGVEQVLIRGVDGEMQCTAEVTYGGNREVSRRVLREAVLTPAVTEVIGRGTGKTPEPPDPEGLPLIRDGYIYLPTGEVLTYYKTDTVQATAYTHTDEGCDRITATGTIVRWGTVAVDPRYIPYGTRLFIMASNGSYIYGIAVAEDCGGDIKGDRMDLYMPTYEQCIQFGRRRCTIYFLG